MNWTPKQCAAIETTGTSLLVSAAAGSGKTAVLAERCAFLVCDAPNPCDLDELLVVTFTRAAATEMRARIEEALRQRAGKSRDQRLGKQFMLLNRAQINTIHGFCTTFLQRHFDALGLDPGFRVLDEQEVTLLRLDVARQLLDDRYEIEPAGPFQRFVDLYGDGDDRFVLEHVLHVHDLMCSVVNPPGWMSNALAGIAEARDGKRLGGTRLGGRLIELLEQWLAGLRGRWVQLAGQIASVEGLEPYSEYVNELLATVQCWQKALEDGNFDALASEVESFKTRGLPRFTSPPPEKAAIQRRIESIRKEMKDGSLLGLCRFTEQQWRDGLVSIHPHLELFIQLVREFTDRFDKAKRELRGLDFSDLERLTLRILRQDNEGDDLAPSVIASSYHRQFKHVLVDEYQDVNEVQDAILNLLSHECVVDEKDMIGNLFCVGDIKQSIYRFRLAQPDRFLRRYERFKPCSDPKSGIRNVQNAQPSLFPDHEEKRQVGQNIDLSSNFRSREPLVNVINAVFEKLMTRDAVDIDYDQSQRLIADASYPRVGGRKTFTGSPVELHLLCNPSRGDSDAAEAAQEAGEELDRTEREAVFIANRVRELIDSGINVAEKAAAGTTTLRPIRHKDIVILLRSMKYKSDELAEMLHRAGIPVHSDSSTGFFESMEIRDMLSLLRVLDNQQQDIPLAAILRSPLSGLPEPEDSLARIRLAYPDSHSVPFHRAVVLYAKDLDDELAAHLRTFLATLGEWRRLARQRPLADVVWHIYDTSGYLAFCSGMADGQQRVANLISFHERARQFGSFQRQGLTRFMQFLQSLAEQSDLGTPSIASSADDVVRVMSIHRSKGLEFPVVIIPDLGKRHNLQDASGLLLADRDAGIGLLVADEARRIRYPSLAHALVEQRIRRQSLAEEMRVLYVAMTRAREHLILVGTCDEDAPQQWKDDWSHHTGPIPPDRVLAGKTMLDWIGPAAAAIQGSGARDHIEMIWHSHEEISQWSVAAAKRAAATEQLAQLARLTPLDPAPTVRPQAHAIIDRLCFEYPHRSLTTTAAAMSVGSMTKEGRRVTGGASPSWEPLVPFEAELASPRCMLEDVIPSATEIGTANHLVLEHLDFARSCNLDDICDQMADLVRRKLLSTEMADTIDLDALLWLMSTPLGEQLRRHSRIIRREVPIYYPIAPEGAGQSPDPLDRIMVRGRIDLLIAEPAGMTVVDFKTDRVTEQTVDARAEFYRPQILSYSDAVGRIVGRPVRSAVLVFLAARLMREMIPALTSPPASA